MNRDLPMLLGLQGAWNPPLAPLVLSSATTSLQPPPLSVQRASGVIPEARSPARSPSSTAHMRLTSSTPLQRQKVAAVALHPTASPGPQFHVHAQHLQSPQQLDSRAHQPRAIRHLTLTSLLHIHVWVSCRQQRKMSVTLCHASSLPQNYLLTPPF